MTGEGAGLWGGRGGREEGLGVKHKRAGHAWGGDGVGLKQDTVTHRGERGGAKRTRRRGRKDDKRAGWKEGRIEGRKEGRALHLQSQQE